MVACIDLLAMLTMSHEITEVLEELTFKLDLPTFPRHSSLVGDKTGFCGILFQILGRKIGSKLPRTHGGKIPFYKTSTSGLCRKSDEPPAILQPALDKWFGVWCPAMDPESPRTMLMSSLKICGELFSRGRDSAAQCKYSAF